MHRSGLLLVLLAACSEASIIELADTSTPDAVIGQDADGDGAADTGGDCNDDDPTAYPGAPEDGGSGAGLPDGVDNDCDGLTDEDLPFGSGVDGALTVDGSTSLASLGGDCAAVSALSAEQATTDAPGWLAAGDRVLLLTVRAPEAPGAWALRDVAAASDGAVVFTQPLASPEALGVGSDGHAVMMLRVPQFTDVTVPAGGELVADRLDDRCGGVLALTATGTLTVEGSVSADGLGYAGGEENVTHDSTGQSGESYAGSGPKGSGANAGGGGGGGQAGSACINCEGNGAGGGHAAPGDDGEASNPDLGDGGAGGSAYGVATLARLTMGSGGGAGALDQELEGGIGGAGGAGGGIVLLTAPTMEIRGSVSARGEDGVVGCALHNDYCGTANRKEASEAEAGGGGGGGSVYMLTRDLSASPDTIFASGGSGQQSASGWKRRSGDGGEGRIRIDADAINGHTPDTLSTEADTIAEPDPGHLGLGPTG